MKLFNLKQKMNKRSYIISTLILLTCAYLIFNIYSVFSRLGRSGLGLPSQMVEFNNQTIQLAMLVPSKWEVINLPNGNHGDFDSKIVVESPFFSAVYIQIFTRQFENNESQGTLDWGKQKAQANPGFKEISLHPYASPKYSGFLYEYARPIYASPVRFVWQSDTYHCVDWYTTKLKTGYDFMFCSLDKSWSETREVFMKMIDSVQLNQ